MIRTDHTRAFAENTLSHAMKGGYIDNDETLHPSIQANKFLNLNGSSEAYCQEQYKEAENTIKYIGLYEEDHKVYEKYSFLWQQETSA